MADELIVSGVAGLLIHQYKTLASLAEIREAVKELKDRKLNGVPQYQLGDYEKERIDLHGVLSGVCLSGAFLLFGRELLAPIWKGTGD